INTDNLYLAKKTVRKVLRTANKFIKYSGSKQTEVDILLYFCKKLRQTGLPFIENTALGNIYKRQVLKITTIISKLHEDLQYDYSKEIELL
ncbi:MAG: hypothetical protein Q8T08_02710, partial [Ignavibacteria bacterium]|nr:hypothetical protein [Ignavibacteria bacterium]